VVGVAKNGKYRSLGEGPIPMVFLPIAQDPNQRLSFVAKQSVPVAGIARAMREAVREADPGVPLAANLPFEASIATGLLPNRMAAMVASSFGVVGLIIATVGLYGVLSYLVVRRRREIGIRMALGAPASRVRASILKEGLKLAGSGVLIGSILALALARAVRSMLFGLDSVDVVGLVGVAFVLLLVAGLASDLPARRAAATDPQEVLRRE
jgi:putative ABC transport system permease protein